jgi:hypothetical protein
MGSVNNKRKQQKKLICWNEFFDISIGSKKEE